MLIIGSVALNQHLGSPIREPGDLDVLVDDIQFEGLKRMLPSTHKIDILSDNHMIIHDFHAFKRTEVYSGDKETSTYQYVWLEENHQPHKQRCKNSVPGLNVASVATLFSIKKSHIHFPRMFEKHIQDYIRLYHMVGGVDKHPAITKLRHKEVEARHGRLKTPSLNKTAEDFFDDKVSNRLFIHDDIHKIMAYYDGVPLYERIKRDPTQVACDKEKFFALSEDDQIRCVLEEAYVIALERKILPMMYESAPYCTPEEAIRYALMRICTTLCSGWFREFATNNYNKIFGEYDLWYVMTFLSAVERDQIKKINLEISDETTCE